MPAFYKVAHYYCVIGEFHAALNSAEKAKEAFPLDADSHTLFLCLKTSFSERKKNRMHINLDIELCKSHIDVLRCDPGCTHAIRSLVGIGEQHNGNWEVQVQILFLSLSFDILNRSSIFLRDLPTASLQLSSVKEDPRHQ